MRAGAGVRQFPRHFRAAVVLCLVSLCGCVLPEETRRAIRVRSTLGDEIDEGEFEDLLQFAWDRHLPAKESRNSRAAREGLWLLLQEIDPDSIAIPLPERARLVTHAGTGADACTESVSRALEAWNATWQGRPLAFTDVAERALQLLLPRLDPHSAYFPKNSWGDMVRSISGRYTGIGIIVQPSDEPMVTEVFEGGPAEGVLRKRDQIVEVDGKPVKGLTTDEYLTLIRGESGSAVTVKVRRDGVLIELTMIRREVRAKAVRRIEAGKERDVLVLRLWSYTDGCAGEMQGEIRRFGRIPRGVIIDLRNNPGGTVDDAVAIVDLFIDRGVVITERGRDIRVLEAEDEGSAMPTTVPILVLVNRFSASASELTAGALQDHGRALVMGETTYGKGTVQEIYKLGDRGAKVTVSRFYLPAGRSTQLAGVAPDLPFPDAEAAKTAAAGGESFERDYDNAIPADAVIGTFRRTSDPMPLLARLKGRMGSVAGVDPEIDASDAMMQEAIRLLDAEPAK